MNTETDHKAFRLGRFLIDVSPLRENRSFQLLFAARALSMLTYGIMSVAINWQVFALTNSSFQVGLVNFSLAASMMVGLLVGGDLADRYDRRRMLMASRMAYPVVALMLLINAAIPAPVLGIIHAAVIVGGLSAGIGAPALMAATASIVERRQLAATSALTAIVVQAGALIGPPIAGGLIVGAGLALCYGVVAAGALATLLILRHLPPLPPDRSATGRGLDAFREGWRFVCRSPLVCGLLLIDVAAVLFASPFAIFPQLGTETFRGSAATVSLLYTASAIGAFVAAITSGWAGQCRRPGMVIIAVVIVWGGAIVAAGLSTALSVTLLFLVVAGFSDTVSEILRVALLQFHTPNSLQGRVSSLWMIQAIVGPAIGGLQIGAVANLVSPAAALIAGGSACVLAAVITGIALPSLRKAKLNDAAPID